MLNVYEFISHLYYVHSVDLIYNLVLFISMMHETKINNIGMVLQAKNNQFSYEYDCNDNNSHTTLLIN